MGKTTAQTSLGQITDPNQFMRFASQVIASIQTVINGNVQFDSNFLSDSVDVSFNNANTVMMVPHTLNKTGVKFLVSDKNVSCDIYHDKTQDTLSAIALFCAVSNAQVSLVLY